MKTNNLIKTSLYLTAFCSILWLASCSDDDDDEALPPEIEMSITEDNVQLTAGNTLEFSANGLNEAVYDEEWKLGDGVVSTTSTYSFEPSAEGEYKISYRAYNEQGTFEFVYTVTVVPIPLAPEVEMSIADENVGMTVGDSQEFSATNQNGAIYEEEWTLGDNVVSTTSAYTFEPSAEGEYQLSYRAFNEQGTFEFTYTINVDPMALAPEVEMSITDENVLMTMGDSQEFSAINQNGAIYEEEWKLGDNVVSTESVYEFVPPTSGDYQLSYRAYNDQGEFEFQYTITVAARIRPITPESNAYVSELLEYLPAPGQFINKVPGNLESAESIVGKSGLVTLGAWGGYATYAFDHTVINQEDAKDFAVIGNAFQNWAEPGIIYVMQDENANGLADDTWYEIKGTAHDLEGSIRNYSVTYFKPENDADDVAWEDSEGNTGSVLKNQFHTQPYYPEWIDEDSYTLTGTILSDINVDTSVPTFVTSMAFDPGYYCDNTAGGDEIDISDAIDAEGNPVELTGIDFVRIQTGLQANGGWLGEISTEIISITDLAIPIQ